MLRSAVGLMGFLTLLLVAYSSNAQQAEAPVYKDGDWWRVKVDMIRPPGVSVAGEVLERFPEYIVKFESNQPKVLAFKETNLQKSIHRPSLPWYLVDLVGWERC
jgi:hypothetical protein